ncbi:MAG: glycosyltransferase family 39 protein [Anaerolineales bacterium]|nr:glycosyltransferase family 39 protein [Anaerolineales bacterium]
MTGLWRRLSERLSWPLALLVGILIVATALRVERPELLDLAGDEASALNQAFDIAHGGVRLIALNSGSVLPHPPVYLYTLALPFLVSPDLQVAAVYRGLLGVAAVAGCWWMTQRYFNQRAALLAALLFAVAPWAVITARKVPIEPLPLYTLVLITGILEVRARRSARGWAIAGIGLALCIGTHLSSVSLVVVAALLLIPAWRTLRLKPALVGMAPLLLVVGAYLAHQVQNDFGDFRRLLDRGAASSAPALDPLLKLQFPLWLSGGWHISDLTGPAYARWVAVVPEWTNVFHAVQALFLIGAIVWVGARLLRGAWLRSTENELAIVTLTWFLAPITLYGLLPLSAYTHYYLPLYPAPFILMGLALDRLWLTRTGRAAASAGLVLVLGWQALTFQTLLSLVATQPTTPGGYAEPIASGLKVADLARAAVAAGQVTDVILVAQGADPAIEPEAGALRALTLGLTQRFVDPSQAMILRGAPSQYLLAPGREAALDWIKPFVAGPLILETSLLRDGQSRYTYARVDGAFVTDTLPEEQWALWESGARLIGLRVTPTDAALEVVTYWSITTVPAYGVHWFHHVYAGEQKIAQADIGGVDVGSWQVGDVLLNHVTIPLPADAPAGPYTVHLGSYTYPELRRLSILDAAGQPAGDAWMTRVP